MNPQDDRSTIASNADTNSATADAASAMAARGPSMPDTDINPKQDALPASTAAAQREQDFQRVQPGWAVFSADSEQLGAVREAGDAWFSLLYGQEHERPMYIPVEYIETIANNRVVLNQPAGLLMDMKLDAPPAAEMAARERRGGRDHDAVPGEPAYAVAAESAADEPAGLRTQAELSPSRNPPQPHEAPPATADPSALPSAQIAAESDAAAGQTGRTPPPQSGANRPSDAPDISQQQQTPRNVAESSYTIRGGAAAAVPPGMDARQALDPQSVSPHPPFGGSAPLPALERRGEGLYAVESTVSSATVARAVHRAQPAPAVLPSTHNAPAPGEGTRVPSRLVNAEDDFYRNVDERTHMGVLSSGHSYDENDGPTHQAGVNPNSEHTPNRTPFSEVGTPGDGQERNVTDLNLIKNQHPDGQPFGTQSATIGRPLRPGQPSVANRAVEGPTGAPELPPPGLAGPDAPSRG